MAPSVRKNRVSVRSPRPLIVSNPSLHPIHSISLAVLQSWDIQLYVWQTLLRKYHSVSWCWDDAPTRSVVLIHLAAAGVKELATMEFDSRAPQQPRNAIQKTWEGFCHCILHLIMKEKTQTQVKNLHKSTLDDYKCSGRLQVTIQGLSSCGRPSLFAMSTQGVRHLVVFPCALFCCLVVLIASGSSLEIHESTSRGLDVEPPAELSTARIWDTSDLPPSVWNTFANVNVLHWSFNNQQTWCDMVAAAEQKLQVHIASHLTYPTLCVGYIDETVHHLAHLLDLRSRAVDWVTWVIFSF